MDMVDNGYIDPSPDRLLPVMSLFDDVVVVLFSMFISALSLNSNSQSA